jgi:hypothetical protein
VDYVGLEYVVPLTTVIRAAVEGPDAPVVPNREIRFTEPNISPGFDLNSLACVVVLASVFSVLEPFCKKYISLVRMIPVSQSHPLISITLIEILHATYSKIFINIVAAMYTMVWQQDGSERFTEICRIVLAIGLLYTSVGILYIHC